MLSVGGYRLVERLGEGGMGVVHLAQLEGEPGAPLVALKVLRPHVVGDDEARERLAREVGSLQRVRSPRVAEVLDADPWGEVPFVATRYVPGPTLHQHVRATGPLGRDALHRTAYCLAEALAAVHAAGVLHRDVKPGNVLLDRGDPVLIDFGLARLADDVRITRTGWLLGTPGYLAPEVLLGEESGPATDVHGWAATLVFAATGRAAYGTGPSAAVMDRTRRGEHDLTGVPEPLRSCLDDCLHPDPARRPPLPVLLDWLGVDVPEAATVVLDAPTRALPPAPEPPRRDEQAWDERGPEPWADAWTEPEPRPSAAVRARAAALLLVGALLAGAAAVAAPLLAAAGLGLLAWLLRAAWTAGEVRRGRRARRGPRWWDAPATLVGLPWHTAAALPGTVLLALWSAVAALAGGLVGYAATASLPGVLAAAGAGAVVGGWWGPGAAGVRGALGGAARAASARTGPWLLALVVLGVGVGALAADGRQGVRWAPLDGPPPGLDRLAGQVDEPRR